MATASAAQACDAFAREPIGGSKAPRAVSDHANADAERFAFGQRADLAVFGGDVAVADVHHARVGVGGAAALWLYQSPSLPIPASCGAQVLASVAKSGAVIHTLSAARKARKGHPS